MLIHDTGKQWGKISQRMEGRNHLQCRSHGQKYINSLKILLKITEDTDKISNKDWEKIVKYESECKDVILKY
jgi:hypothetical protein